jgi:hypothetical protein
MVYGTKSGGREEIAIDVGHIFRERVALSSREYIRQLHITRV